MKRAVSLLVSLIAYILMSINFASASIKVNIFEATFERSIGSPESQTVFFPSLKGEALIKIYNGSSDEEDGTISSAIVMINNKTVFGSSNFKQRTSVLTRELDVSEGLNTMQVVLKSKPGAKLTISIYQEIDASAAAVIGPNGGIVEVTDSISPIYGTRIEIPSGAINQPVVIAIKAGNLDDSELIGTRVGNPIELQPSGLTFKRPVTLNMPFSNINNEGYVNGTNIDGKFAKILSKNNADVYWEELQGEYIDFNKNYISSVTNHFTVFVPAIVKFTSKNIKYFVESYPVNNPGFKNGDGIVDTIRIDNAIKSVLSEWGNALHCSDMKIELAPTSNADEANILIAFENILPSGKTLRAIRKDQVKIIIDDDVNSSLQICADCVAADSFQYVLKHELGHALGLTHSTNWLMGHGGCIEEVYRLVNIWHQPISEVELTYPQCFSPPVMAPIASETHSVTTLSSDDITRLNTLYACTLEVITVASGLGSPYKVVVESPNAYVVVAGYGTDGAVLRINLNNGSVTPLASGLLAPRSLAIDSNNVYFTEVNGGTIKRVSKSGGDISIIASGLNGPADVAIYGSNIYWSEYYGGSITGMSLDNGSITPLVTGLYHSYSIAADSTYVYYTDNNSHQIKKVNVLNRNQFIVGNLFSASVIHNELIIDDAFVYYRDCTDNNTCSIAKADKSGTTRTTIASNVGAGGWMSLDTTNVYFPEYYGGNVKKVSKNGGDVIPIVTGESGPHGTATDTNYVYWTDSNVGTLKKMRK